METTEKRRLHLPFWVAGIRLHPLIFPYSHYFHYPTTILDYLLFLPIRLLTSYYVGLQCRQWAHCAHSSVSVNLATPFVHQSCPVLSHTCDICRRYGVFQVMVFRQWRSSKQLCPDHGSRTGAELCTCSPRIRNPGA